MCAACLCILLRCFCPQDLHSGQGARPGPGLPRRRERQQAGARAALHCAQDHPARLPGPRGVRPLLVSVGGGRPPGAGWTVPGAWWGCGVGAGSCRPRLCLVRASHAHVAPAPQPITRDCPLCPLPHQPCRSSLAFQPPEELALTLELAAQAGITVVSLPLVNQWTQVSLWVGFGAFLDALHGLTALPELACCCSFAVGMCPSLPDLTYCKCRPTSPQPTVNMPRTPHPSAHALSAPCRTATTPRAARPAGAASRCCTSCALRGCPPLWPPTTRATSSTPMATSTCWRSSPRWEGRAVALAEVRGRWRALRGRYGCGPAGGKEGPHWWGSHDLCAALPCQPCPCPARLPACPTAELPHGAPGPPLQRLAAERVLHPL